MPHHPIRTLSRTLASLLLGTGMLLAAVPASASEPLVIAADALPHAQILQQASKIDPSLKLKIVEFPNGVNPNELLAGGDVQANYFQHVPYLRLQEQALKQTFAVAATVHIEPLGIYSQKHQSLKDVPSGGIVSLPNNASNLSRALFLLQDSGLIRLKPEFSDPATHLAKPADIIENPRNLTIKEVDSALLPRTLPDVALAIINGNYALEAGLKPARDALALEKVANNPYANVLVTTPQLLNDARIQQLSKVLESAELARFIQDQYEGSVIAVNPH